MTTIEDAASWVIDMDLAPCLLFLLLSFFFLNVSSSPPRSYIIQVEEPIESLTEGSLLNWYKSFLPPDTDDLSADQRLLHSYRDIFSGFAARLTEEEVQVVGKKEGFVRAFPDRVLHVLTTHTPKFLGLELGKKGLWNDSRLGSGVIIGVLDTGVTPGHPSYDDEGSFLRYRDGKALVISRPVAITSSSAPSLLSQGRWEGLRLT